MTFLAFFAGDLFSTLAALGATTSAALEESALPFFFFFDDVEAADVEVADVDPSEDAATTATTAAAAVLVGIVAAAFEGPAPVVVPDWNDDDDDDDDDGTGEVVVEGSFLGWSVDFLEDFEEEGFFTQFKNATSAPTVIVAPTANATGGLLKQIT